MYIKEVRLTNIRCFKTLKVDFSSDDGVQMWKVAVGENGVGKTTFLRSIAIGLCDETGAAGLLQDSYGDLIRWGEPSALIEIDLADGSKSYSIKTEIRKDSNSKFEIIERDRKLESEIPWDKIFVCGYGARRSVTGNALYEEYSIADALYTLFDYDGELQNPETMLWRLSYESDEGIDVRKWIDEILMLEPESTQLDSGGLKITKKWAEDVYLGSLPDGYTATITFILDLLGWASLRRIKGQPLDLSGIIIIDEIESHLHPSWQKYFIQLLHRAFPKIQFIASTHSALIAIGTANLPEADKVCSLLTLLSDGDHVVERDRILPPYSQRADQVLTSILFGLDSSSSDNAQQRIELYSQLLSKPSLSDAENKKVNELRASLDVELGSAETELQQLVETAVHESIGKLATKAVEAKSIPKPAIDLEIKRQLKALWD
jgi:hypothetical protein